VDGEHLVVSGLYFRGASSGGDGVKISGLGCRLTDTAMVDCEYRFYVHLFGESNRLDHCFLSGKANDSPTLQVEVGDRPNRHRIDHNHFGHRPPLGRNGGETIRVGYSHQSMSESGTVVERNLFERCDGEIEIVSNKSCGNLYRANTFLDCDGWFTLRHGDRCVVDGNFFLGRRKKGSGGVRIIGEGHKVINNYIEGVETGGFRITAGIPDSPLNGYFRARDVLIAFNTVADTRGPCLELDAGIGTSGRTLRPDRVTIANNVFAPADGGTFTKGSEGERFAWVGNVAWGSSTPSSRDGVRRADPRLSRAGDGLLRPAPDSPLRDTAQGEYPVATDVDGQPRGGPRDVGCDELSDTPATQRPLSAADVGPAWPIPDLRDGRPRD
jgi:poly(beta-D-mannuronate) lyase